MNAINNVHSIVVVVDSILATTSPPEAQRYVTIAVQQGAIRPSSSPPKVADIIGFFFLDYTTHVAC